MTTQNQAPIPTVTGEPQRPVVLPGAPSAEPSEGERLARALAALEAPAVEPPPAAAPPAAPPPEPPPAAPAAAPPVTSEPTERDRLAALEQQIERQRLEQQTAERERSLTEREGRIKRFEDFETALKSKDVLGALEGLGYSFDDLSRAAVERRGTETEASKVSKDIAELRAELSALKTEKEAAARAQVEAEAFAEIDAAITARSPLLTQYGAQAREAVFAELAREFDRSGRTVVPSLEKAISAVEGEYSALVTKALSVESLRTKFLPVPDPAPPASRSSDTASPVNRGPQTLTNDHVSTPAARADLDVLSESERLARALRHLE